MLWVGMEYVVVVLFLMAELLGVVAAEDEVDNRPLWTPLRADDGEVFQSNEVLQMYHLQVREALRLAGERTPMAALSGCRRSC